MSAPDLHSADAGKSRLKHQRRAPRGGSSPTGSLAETGERPALKTQEARCQPDRALWQNAVPGSLPNSGEQTFETDRAARRSAAPISVPSFGDTPTKGGVLKSEQTLSSAQLRTELSAHSVPVQLDGAARRGVAPTVLSETGKNLGPLRERRSILRGLIAAPLASLLGFAVCQVAEPDPTFALIEAHRAAWDHFGAMVGEWSDKLGDPPADVEARRDAASDAENDALEALLTPEPTTLAGMRALTEYMLDYVGKMNGPRYSDEPAHWALATLVDACRRLIPKGGAA